MEEKKGALHPVPVEDFRQKGGSLPEPGLLQQEMDAKRRRPSLFLLILGPVLFFAVCFAVYALIGLSCATRECSEKATARPLVAGQPGDMFSSGFPPALEKSNVHLQITVKGSGDGQNKTRIIITNTDRPRLPDEFTTLRDFIRKITSVRPVSEEVETIRPAKPKVKTISFETWEVKKLPKESSVEVHHGPFSLFGPERDSLEDIIDTFVNPFHEPQVHAPRKDIVITPNFPPLHNAQSSDNSFPRTIFKDFEDVLSNVDKMFDSKPIVEDNNKPEPHPPKIFRKIITSGPFIVPFNFNRGFPFFHADKPREEVEVFKKPENPYMDRYRYENKPEKNDDDIMRKIFGLDAIKPKFVQKQTFPVGRDSSFSSEESPRVFFFNDNMAPKWNKYPKKYDSSKYNNSEMNVHSTPKPVSQATTETPTSTTDFAHSTSAPTTLPPVVSTTHGPMRIIG